MTLVNSLVPRELVSITQHGSWYQVAFMNENVLNTITTQGVKKTKQAIKYFNIIHTKGTPMMLGKDLYLSTFMD